MTGCAPTQVVPPAEVVAYRAVSNARLPDGVQWPGWRGGSRHAVSSAARLPTQWSEQHGVRWKIEVPGRGNSSPIVYGDDVLLTSIVAGEGGEEAVVMCFDRATGGQRWQQSLGVPSGNSHNKNGHASATPATDGQRVYVAFGGLGLAAFDLAGKRVWHAPQLRTAHDWGTASSPLLVDNLVVHIADGDGESALIALDKTTGQQAWRTPRASRGSWTSPVLANGEIIVGGTGSASGSPGEMIAYDPSNGKELWKARGTTDIVCPTAIVGDGIVVSTSGSNGPIVAVKPDGQGDVTEQRLWTLPSGGAYVPTGLIYRDRLFLISDSGMATCHDVADGAVIWRKRLQGAFSASLVAGAEQIYAVSERGDVYVFKASDQFELIATNRLHEPCMATPAIAHGELYLRTQQHLYCVADVNLASTTPADVPPVVDPASIRSAIDPAPEGSTLGTP